MKFNTHSNRVLSGVAIVALVVVSLTQSATIAGTFHWGDFAGTDVMFLDVTEDNLLANSVFAPMPGTGGPIVVGNSLHLDPQGFASQSNDSTHLIDSTLSTIIMAGPNGAIGDITINELGDYSLGGLIGGQASAEVGAAFLWTILEVDNQAVSFATQATNLILGTGSGPNGGKYVRPGDDGTAVIWNGTASIDLGGYLDSLNHSGSVTKVRLTFDNTLQTAADDVSNAFIKKKSIDIVVGPPDDNGNVPEPSSAVLLGLGLIATALRRLRRAK